MKKYSVIILALMLTISLSVSAQSRQGRFNNKQPRQSMQMNAKDRVERLAKQIELTEAQKTEIEALFNKQDEKRAADMAKMRELRNQTAANREEMRALREKEMKQNQAELEKIIGKEKAEKLDSIRQDRMNSNRQGRRN